jgi:hypothetical protein
MNKKEISTFLSIIALNTNGLYSPTKSHRITECIKSNIQLFVLCKKLISWAKTHTETEGTRTENDILRKWNVKASRISYFQM